MAQQVNKQSNWLLDKYNKDIDNLRAKIIDLEIQLKNEKVNNELLRKTVNKKHFKYVTEEFEFSKELMKSDVINKYKREINNLHKSINKLKNKYYE